MLNPVEFLNLKKFGKSVITKNVRTILQSPSICSGHFQGLGFSNQDIFHLRGKIVLPIEASRTK